ncbi:dicarboxylate/amino acid:cation symporter [Flavobacterium sp. SUN052]|uniref:dicarboxylate/amino acid:cation symporter n=1 Tax=Flavobacterium sp. SUN052 TaxID=3002441 RepID=UPI00237D6C8B|nr:dicarboxylate/amino acid:cation symporter [Flavobacterium sp. SUN052]MEC4005117.1 dicarboxylate/amino acid:cation symporter [Flavobacterium sp. SUN052]
MSTQEPTKKSNLTRNIFIALVLGIAIGFAINKFYVSNENKKIDFYTKNVEQYNSQLKTYLPDTSSVVYKNSVKSIERFENDKKQILSTVGSNKNDFQNQYKLIAKIEDTISKLEVLKMKPAKDTLNAEYSNIKDVKKFSETKLTELTSDRDKKLQWFAIIADIFLRLIKMIVAPLVFTTLVVGIAKLGDIKTVGRIGGKTMLWFVSASLVSLMLGMLLVNLFKPGESMHLALPLDNQATGIDKAALSIKDFVTHVFPKSFIESMANNEILQIVIFSIFFGISAAALGKKSEKIIKALDDISHIILKLTGFIMNFAPYAVFGAMVVVIGKQGIGILTTYAIFISEFYFGLLLLWCVLILAGSVFLKKRIFELFKKIKDPILLAFSTSSSEAAFPKTMLELERFGCSNKITSFVLPLGYSFNLDGSMMYMTFASIFIAQSYGINLTIETQISMLLVLMLTSKGIAGVPRASLVVIAGTLASFKIPEVGIALLLGIDPILDMGRSATNVVGNSIATAVVSKLERELTN